VASVAISVNAAGPEHFDRILALLEEARLPTRDLTPLSVDGFLVATDAQEVLGAVALERYGDVGLVRSLVVAPDRRAEGLGKAMVRVLEAHARAEGISLLVLLTETAKGLFATLGYQEGRRADAPAAIQTCSEFALVCPATAIYMEKRLR
jgi:amino-acid N-acetyltransferase